MASVLVGCMVTDIQVAQSLFAKTKNIGTTNRKNKMKSMLKADDFYVIHHISNNYGGGYDSEYWSLPGLMFMSDILLQAVEKAGLEASKTTVRVGDFQGGTDNSCMSLAYPSPKTTIVSDIRIKGTKLEMVGRGKSKYDEKDKTKIVLADPTLIDQIAVIIQASLPKKSKYEQVKK